MFELNIWTGLRHIQQILEWHCSFIACRIINVISCYLLIFDPLPFLLFIKISSQVIEQTWVLEVILKPFCYNICWHCLNFWSLIMECPPVWLSLLYLRFQNLLMWCLFLVWYFLQVSLIWWFCNSLTNLATNMLKSLANYFDWAQVQAQLVHILKVQLEMV